MAKKQRRKNVITFENKIDSWISRIYKCGVIHSTIFHTLLFLLLALIIPENITHTHIKLNISFEESTETKETFRLQEIDFAKISLGQGENKETLDTTVDTSGEVELVVDAQPLDSEETATVQDFYIPTPELITIIDKKCKTQDFENDSNISVTETTTNTNCTIENSASADIRSIISSIAAAGDSAQNIENGAGFPSLGERLKQAGAKTGDIQISIMWNSRDDIDLHVSYTPGNGLVDNINWINRVGRLSPGALDIDRNANSNLLTDTPVENIFWQHGSSPKGFFVVYIHFYRSWTGQNKIPVLARLKIGKNTQEIKTIAILYRAPQEIYRFHYPN